MHPYINLIYDFNRRPYDVDWWSTQLGAPTVVSGSLEIGGSTSVMSADFMKGNLEMEITVVSAPAAGHSRKFGWMSVAQGAYAYFEISGATFQAATGDGEGNTQTSEITWNSDWDNTATLFQIRWDASGFTFLVNGVRKAKISELNKTPRVTLSPYITSTGTPDSLKVKYVSIIGAQTIFHIESVNSDHVPSDPGHIVSINETMTITEAITVAHDLDEAVSNSETQTITEAITVAHDLDEAVSTSDTQTITESVTMFTDINYGSSTESVTMTEAVTVSAPA